jgi:hypothetical protein
MPGTPPRPWIGYFAAAQVHVEFAHAADLLRRSRTALGAA